ncbi:hypothetical protein B0H19DRAFT_1099823 [Mycena capillaripes]|nr:hypothetical protein B0H19DRAFT_1099823 [Mycena capillaripes]
MHIWRPKSPSYSSPSVQGDPLRKRSFLGASHGQIKRACCRVVAVIQYRPTMNTILSQLLSLAPVALIPFIPNDALRYITLGVTFVAFAAYFLRQNTLSSRVDRVEASLWDLEELFTMALEECGREPYLLAEAGLKLAT